MKITPFFRWYDLWVGMYIDTKNRAIYLCPLPMVGLKISLPYNKANEPELLSVRGKWGKTYTRPEFPVNYDDE